MQDTSKAVIVVDDTPDILDIISSSLQDCGFRIHGTSDPHEALRIAAVNQVDLLLTDIIMPEMSGVELAQRMLAQQPTVKILLMTGYTPPEQEIVYPILRKPFRLDDLLTRIETLLSP